MDNLRRMPINVEFLMNRLPPHLRPVLGLRSLLPRIGGAGYMMVPSESQLPVMGGSNGLKADRKSVV